MAERAKWYVVHTYSGYENAVATAIMKAAENRKMTDLILEVSMILTDDSWHLIHNVRGATGFVGSDGKAVPLTEEEILALGVEHHEVVVTSFEVGDTVRVIDGPLAGFNGTVDEVSPENDLVRVTVSMFGRETPVDRELDQVEPIKD